MKLRTLLTAFLIITCKAVSAQQWIDITDIYLTNPSFNGNSTTGWTWQSNAGSQKADRETFEFWNGTFDIWQTIQVPAGKYRFRMAP